MPKKILYKPGQNEPFELSRSKIDLFLQCPRCFYIDRSEKHRIARPSGPMSYIPTALDILLKKDFDKDRNSGTVHRYCKDHDIDLIPFQHEEIKDWQNNRKGIRYHDPETNFILYVKKITSTNRVMYGDVFSTSSVLTQSLNH